MALALYLTDTYLFESTASIVNSGEDERGSYVSLDQTIFYPQGGGQPSDQGKISGEGFELSVLTVRRIGEEIRHYLEKSEATDLKGLKVACLVDKDRRMLNARYHTAAHLLGNVAEALYSGFQAIKGHSFPGEAYVEFQGASLPEADKLMDGLKAAIDSNLKTKIFETDRESFERLFYKLPYEIPGDKKFRVMQIESFPPVPCGGTHLSNTGEIGIVEIGKIKTKNGMARIAYGVRSI